MADCYEDDELLLPCAPSSEEAEAEAAVEVLAEGQMGGAAAPRGWGKMQLTVENAAAAERVAGAATGTYYVASAKQKLRDLSHIHGAWFRKTKNRASPYLKVQKEVESFYASCQKAFDERFKEYLGQPGFEALGTRKRQRTQKK